MQAREVAVKCSLDTFDVWSAWGLAKLRLGQYAEAAEKFGQCLRGVGHTDPRGDVRQSRLVESIVEVLEAPPCPMLDDIQCMKDELRATIKTATTAAAKNEVYLHNARETMLGRQPAAVAGPGGGGGGGGGGDSSAHPAAGLAKRRARLLLPLVAVQAVNQGRVSLVSTLNSERFSEATRYLTLYGTAKELCKFYLLHGFMERACEFMLSKAVPPRVFVETVFVHALSTGSFAQLKDTLRLLSDGTLDGWGPYLHAACKYSNERKMHAVLYDLQVYMDDDFRAGITSLKFAAAVGIEVPRRMELLQQARGHFEAGHAQAAAAAAADGGERGGASDAAVPADGNMKMRLSDADVDKYKRTITFQVALINFFVDEAEAAPNPEVRQQPLMLSGLSLFNDSREREKVCVEMIHRGR
jgi:hypothetical protein